MKATSRREFFALAAASSAVIAVPVFAQQPAPPSPAAAPQTQRPKRPDPLAPELVREFVGAGHGNLEKTREMLAATPGLLNATWDWGGGDFETALGGAGHMGRKDIADFLISQGARMDIFIAAMLGHIDFVKAALKAYPSLAESKGPHGITLMAHAERRGAENAEMVSFLKSLKT